MCDFGEEEERREGVSETRKSNFFLVRVSQDDSHTLMSTTVPREALGDYPSCVLFRLPVSKKVLYPGDGTPSRSPTQRKNTKIN